MDGSDRAVDRLIMTPNHGITVSKSRSSLQQKPKESLSHIQTTAASTGAVQPTNQIEVSLWTYWNQAARESTEIARLRGIRRSVMVVTWQCNNPANKPPPHFCPMLALHKGGGGVITRFCGASSIVYIFA